MKKFRYSCLLILLILAICSSTGFAAEKYQGMPLYRDGVILGEWHAGLFYLQDKNYTEPIVHIAGSNYEVARVEYDSGDDNFLKGNDFEGVYCRPGVSSSTLDNIRHLANELTTENISYCGFNMLEHHASGDTIYKGDIDAIRCDGVVEYCYEYYDVKLQSYYGTIREYWDISNVTDCCYHTTAYVMSPHNQAQELTKLSDTAD